LLVIYRKAILYIPIISNRKNTINTVYISKLAMKSRMVGSVSMFVYPFILGWLIVLTLYMYIGITSINPFMYVSLLSGLDHIDCMYVYRRQFTSDSIYRLVD